MGTIMAASMLIALVFATKLPGIRQVQKLPKWLKNAVAGLAFVAGSWNVLWYAVRHITEFWGLAALVSGVLLLITSIYILDENRLPSFLQRWRAMVLLLLLCFALLYGITIYRL